MDSRTLTICLDDLEPTLAADMAAIAARRGRPLTLDEASELRRAAERIRLAYGGQSLGAADDDALLPRSVLVGGCELRSLTLAGRIMLRRLYAWNAEQPMDQEPFDVLQAWVFACSWDRQQMARCVTREDAAAIVVEWAPRLTCSQADLYAAFDLLQGLRAECGAADAGKKNDVSCQGELVEVLAAHSADSNYWLYDVSEEHAIVVLRRLSDRRAREAAEIAAATGRQRPAHSDDRVDAVAEYCALKERLAVAVAPAARNHG